MSTRASAAGMVRETGDLNGDDEDAFNVANKLAAAEAERDALARMVWRLTKGRQPKMNESFPFNPATLGLTV